MTFFDNILLSTIYIIFPLSMWALYQIYEKNLDRNIKKITFDFAILTSFYLMLKLKNIDISILILMIQIPIILAFFKKRIFLFEFLSISVIFYLNKDINLLLIEYIISNIFFFLYYIKTKKYSLYVFILSKYMFFVSFLLKIVSISKPNIIVFIILFSLLAYFLIILIEKTEDMISYSVSISKLEEEKRFRNSLFKVTHEIKNPIAVCKGYLDMFDIENKEHPKKYIPILREEISKVLILLQDFLSLNKIHIEKEPMDIYYLLENVVSSVKPLLKEKGVRLNFDNYDEELFIDGDYNRLSQVAINIIKNALESMEDEKILTINTKVLKEKIKIEFKDTGKGMSKEELEKISEPFFTTKKNGTGLGVYLSKEIIKSHGGNIEYKSKENVGTTVIITLPIKKDILFS